MTQSHDPKPNPVEPARKAPPARPSHGDAGAPRRLPPDEGTPGTIEAPPSREPGPPPASDVTDDDPVDAATEHEGATEEQVGDRTGPGAGYDEGT